MKTMSCLIGFAVILAYVVLIVSGINQAHDVRPGTPDEGFVIENGGKQ